MNEPETDVRKRATKQLQDFRDKKQLKIWPPVGHFILISPKFVLCYPCVRPHLTFILYLWSSYIALFLSYITSISQNYSNSKWLLSGHVAILCSQQLNRADIAQHICQIKRRSAGNVFLKRAKVYFFVCGHIVIKGLIKWGIKMSPKHSLVVCDGNVKYE